MTLATIRTRASQRLNEGATGPVFYTATELTAAINEGNRFFCLLSLGLEKTATYAGGSLTHLLPTLTDLTAVLRITDSTGATVRPASLADLAALDPAWLVDSGAQSRYCVLGADFLILYGGTGALSITYARAPVALVADGDIPEFPAEYHPALIKYAIYRCRQIESGQEFAKSLAGFSEFLDAAAHFAAYVRSRNVGTRYDKVPFELQSYDRSKLLGVRPDLMPQTEIPQGAGLVPAGMDK